MKLPDVNFSYVNESDSIRKCQLLFLNHRQIFHLSLSRASLRPTKAKCNILFFEKKKKKVGLHCKQDELLFAFLNVGSFSIRSPFFILTLLLFLSPYVGCKEARNIFRSNHRVYIRSYVASISEITHPSISTLHPTW